MNLVQIFLAETINDLLCIAPARALYLVSNK